MTRPEAHREHARRQAAGLAETFARLESLGVAVISSVPAENSLWICDLCNEQIPVVGEWTLIPLLGSYALCVTCVSGFSFWPKAWIEPTPRACVCDACALGVAP